jgi:hypothetical protein
MMNHFAQPSASLRRVMANDVLLQATAMSEVNPEVLLRMPNVRRFSKGTSWVCRPKPRRAFVVDAEQLVRRRNLSIRVRDQTYTASKQSSKAARHTQATMIK